MGDAMRPSVWSLAFLGLLACGPRSSAADQAEKAAAGGITYRRYCARCHGASGAGDGPGADNLPVRPGDLRLIARRNQGEFPAEQVRRIVDGRAPVEGHGTPDMPRFGDALKNADTGYDDRVVALQIRAVVEYLRTLQIP